MLNRLSYLSVILLPNYKPMHTLKTKRELEIFEQGVQKWAEEMKKQVALLMQSEILRTWKEFPKQFFNDFKLL